MLICEQTPWASAGASRNPASAKMRANRQDRPADEGTLAEADSRQFPKPTRFSDVCGPGTQPRRPAGRLRGVCLAPLRVPTPPCLQCPEKPNGLPRRSLPEWSGGTVRPPSRSVKGGREGSRREEPISMHREKNSSQGGRIAFAGDATARRSSRE